MDIAALNERITIQHSTALVDAIGNRTNGWQDYFSCYATVSGEDKESGKEDEAVGLTVEANKAVFTARWCSEIAAVAATEYRLLFRSDIYNILSVDHMNYKKRCVKFRCQRVRR